MTRATSYQKHLLERIKNDPNEAEGYLNAAFEEGIGAFLVALKDVIDAGGGATEIAKKVSSHRVTIHRMLKSDGNPKVNSLVELLDAAGWWLKVEKKEPFDFSEVSSIGRQPHP